MHYSHPYTGNKYCTPHACCSALVLDAQVGATVRWEEDTFVRGLRNGEGWVTWVGGERGGEIWVGGEDGDRVARGDISHSVLHVFVLTVSDTQCLPRNTQDHQTTVLWRSQTEPQHREDVLLFLRVTE